MGRSSSAIQAEITALETLLQSADSAYSSVGSDGTTLSKERRKDLTDRLDVLYIQLDRTTGNAPMLVRGVVKGL